MEQTSVFLDRVAMWAPWFLVIASAIGHVLQFAFREKERLANTELAKYNADLAAANTRLAASNATLASPNADATVIPRRGPANSYPRRPSRLSNSSHG